MGDGINPKEYTIGTLADILALTPDQRTRCVADLAGWTMYINQLEADMELSVYIKSRPVMVWVDDELPPGTISGVIITEEVME